MKTQLNKSIMLIILSILMAYPAVSQYGRYRTIDLGVNILNLKEGDYIKSPTKLSILYSIKNYGPDTVFIEDSLILWIFITPYGTEVEKHPCEKPLFPGDSIILQYEAAIDYDQDNNYFQAGVTVQLYNHSKLYPFFYETGSVPTHENNSASVRLYHRWEFSGVAAGKLQNESAYFPNPIRDNTLYVYPSIRLGSVFTIEIINLMGVTVFASNSQDWQQVSTGYKIHLPNDLANGVYLLKMDSAKRTETHKIVVQKE